MAVQQQGGVKTICCSEIGLFLECEAGIVQAGFVYSRKKKISVAI